MKIIEKLLGFCLVFFCLGLFLLHQQNTISFGQNLPVFLVFLGLIATGIFFLKSPKESVDFAKKIGLPPAIAIVFIVAITLFVELSLIRWQSACLQVFGFFKNLTLLACFLGLGAGYAVSTRAIKTLPYFIPAICCQFIFFYVLRFTHLQTSLKNPVLENLTMGLGTAASSGSLLLTYGFLTFSFLFTALALFPIGGLAGEAMKAVETKKAYSLNLMGSILGIAAFFVSGRLWLGPIAWLFIPCLALLLIVQTPRMLKNGLLFLIAAAVFLAYPFSINRLDVYSPFQTITLMQDSELKPTLEVNHFYFQNIVDGRPESGVRTKEQMIDLFFYDTPYRLKPNPQRVLVVGSGTGNDVAAGVRNGAGHIDGVEIDPVILQYGSLLHPENPYGHSSVSGIRDDARSYMKKTKHVYDLVIFGLLDSHSTLGGVSNVRLDSFVYTRESLKQALNLLSSDGLLILNFYLVSEEQGKKFYQMIEEAWGTPPLVLENPHRFRLTYVAGPGLKTLVLPEALAKFKVPESHWAQFPNVDTTTDDWPFPYMMKKTYPLSYVTLNGLLLIIGLFFLKGAFSGVAFKWHSNLLIFFLTGAGFMLVETKAITELALVYGSTDEVVTLTILFVLLMAYFANTVSMRYPQISAATPLFLVTLFLILGYFFSGSLLNALTPTPAKIIFPIILTLPVFFSGLAFSSLLSAKQKIGPILAFNLFGALFGGLLEYNSMAFGFNSLYLLAAFIYGAALLSLQIFSRFAASKHAP